MSEMTIADVLDKAADLIEPEGAWRQHGMAGLPNGLETGAGDPNATCFCAGGAIIRLGESESARQQALRWLKTAIHTVKVTLWNDDPDRTQSEVVAKLREAATLARLSPPKENERG